MSKLEPDVVAKWWWRQSCGGPATGEDSFVTQETGRAKALGRQVKVDSQAAHVLRKAIWMVAGIMPRVLGMTHSTAALVVYHTNTYDRAIAGSGGPFKTPRLCYNL